MKNLILLLIPFISFSQVEVPDEYWLDDSNFEKAISSGAFGDDNESTIVIEFWAKFNEDIAEAPATKKEYRIRMAPTILIFKNGVVEQAFKAGLDLLLPTDLQEIQNAIREINAASNF